MNELFSDISSEINIEPKIMLFQLTLAFVVGLIIALHPTDWKKTFSKENPLKIAKAQILLCVAGALLINVIGDSTARAFGIFGIGSFVRFRAPVKNPMDAAKMFMLLGVGMAIGLDLYIEAIMCTAFLFVALFILSLIKISPTTKNIDPSKDTDNSPDTMPKQVK